MLAKELINDEIPSLKVSDTGLKALSWMDEFRVSHLPIVNRKKLLGVISDTQVLDLNNPDIPIGKYENRLMRPFVLQNQHALEALKLISTLNFTLMPVLDESENYLGVISISKMIQFFSKMSALQEPGGIIVLEININDYSLSQIAQIVEGNDAKILTFYLTPHQNSNKLEVTIKTNKEDLSSVLQTFYRYKYTVIASYHQKAFGDDLKQLYDSFMNYINM